METQTKLIFDDLKSKYKRMAIGKKEITQELGVSVSTIDLNIQKGIGIPNYRKLGTARNAKVVFNLVDVANFLTQTIKTA